MKLNYTLFNHTPNTSTQYSTRLNGTENESVGLARSLSVMPGDVVKMEVFAKYLNPDHSTRTTVLNDFIAALALGTVPSGTLIDGGLPGSIGNEVFPFEGLLDKSDQTGATPKAFLNFLVFNRRDVLVDGGFIPITAAAKESGQNIAHQQLYKELQIKEAGYVYIYLSNDNVELGGQPVEVYFDDFKVETTDGPVAQINGYYPYGSESYTYVRENDEEVKYKFQGKEYDKVTGLHDFHARQYDATLGRWLAADPAGQFAGPYTAMGNNPVMSIDPDGRFAWFVPIIIGAYVGSAAGIVSDHANYNELMNGIWKGALIGALIGAAGIFAPAGILPGIAYGSATGAAIGAGSAALNGRDIGQGAKYGAITGGLLGGISGGLSAHQNGANIWTGQSGRIEALSASELPEGITGSESTGYNDKELNAFRREQLGSHPGVLRTTIKIEKGVSVNSDGQFEGPDLLGIDGKPAQVVAYTRQTIWGGGRFSTIRVSPSAFESNAKLFLTLGHEYVHAYHYYYSLYNLVPADYYSDFTEYGAYEWTQRAVFANKFDAYTGYYLKFQEYVRKTPDMGVIINFTNAPVNLIFKH